MKAYEGVKVWQVHTFLTPELWKWPVRFTQEELNTQERSLWRPGGWLGPRATECFREGTNILPLPRIEPWSHIPACSPFTIPSELLQVL